MTVELYNRSRGTVTLGHMVLKTNERMMAEVTAMELEELRIEAGSAGVRVRVLPEAKPVTYERKGA